MTAALVVVGLSGGQVRHLPGGGAPPPHHATTPRHDPRRAHPMCRDDHPTHGPTLTRREALA
ncbi:hypothetical protein, partial [Dietzia lutea]|uniref:hypothetical protein n=1 Tax=Dietzia lutea TaxID=546160 RepID=UPI001F2D8B6D